MTKTNVHESISKLLETRLQRRLSQKFDRTSCIEIFNDIFFTISEVIKQSNTPLSNESVNLLSQMYYDAIEVNGTELDPNIFTQRASVKNIPTRELALLATMTRGTVFSEPFLHEIKTRS